MLYLGNFYFKRFIYVKLITGKLILLLLKVYNASLFGRELGSQGMNIWQN